MIDLTEKNVVELFDEIGGKLAVNIGPNVIVNMNVPIPKEYTHKGLIQMPEGKATVLLRLSKKCWITPGGKRFRQETGFMYGRHRIKLDLESIEEVNI